MGDYLLRKHTFVGTFDDHGQAIRAHMIHDVIFDAIGLREEEIYMIQPEIGLKKFYVKLSSEQKLREVLARGHVNFKMPNGVSTKVTLADAGNGVTKLRVFRLPPEVDDQVVISALSRYGLVVSCVQETWSRQYRFHGKLNGVREVKMEIKGGGYVPSHVKIGGVECLVFYDGQPPSCWKCQALGHLFADCPRRKKNQDGNRRWETANNNNADNNNKRPAAGTQPGAGGSSATPPVNMTSGAPSSTGPPPSSSGPLVTEEEGKKSTVEADQQQSPVIEVEADDAAVESVTEEGEEEFKVYRRRGRRRRKGSKASQNSQSGSDSELVDPELSDEEDQQPICVNSEKSDDVREEQERVVTECVEYLGKHLSRDDENWDTCVAAVRDFVIEEGYTLEKYKRMWEGPDTPDEPELTEQQAYELQCILEHGEHFGREATEEEIKHTKDAVREGYTLKHYIESLSQRLVNSGGQVVPPEVKKRQRADGSPEEQTSKLSKQSK